LVKTVRETWATLYYRLSVFPIEIAPLRRRKEDIPLLAAHLVEKTAQRLNRPTPRLTRAALLELQRYDWPGNIRELENVIERAMIMSRADELIFDLPASDPTTAGPRPPVASAPTTDASVLPERELRRHERDNVLRALEKAKGKLYGPGGAADLLGVKATTLASRMKRLGIERRAGRFVAAPGEE
jgi:transcriptional regulator with GAF, ATPase, and Fis domain